MALFIDDYFFDFAGGDWPAFVVGDAVDSIRGVVHYYFGEYVIYLRDLNDLNFDSNQGCISDGDINSDGTVNAVDVVTAVNFVLGLGEPSDEQLCKGDVNGDGVIDNSDLVLLVVSVLNDNITQNSGDFNYDQNTDIIDILILSDHLQ